MQNQPTTFYAFKATSMQGKTIEMSVFKGKIVVVVNIATKCGLNYQLSQLEDLHQRYHDKGVVILGFPCNQFAFQQPGNNKAIAESCAINHGVSFQLLEKIKVNGPFAHPLYKYLKQTLPGKWLKRIRWNYTKFIIDQNGVPVKRFGPRDAMADVEMAIKDLLGK